MRKSRSVNLLILGGSMFVYSAFLCAGCGRQTPFSSRARYDPPWYDAQRRPIAKAWTTDANGRKVPVQTPYDENGKPIAFDADGHAIPPPGTVSTYSGSSYSRSRTSWWPWLLMSRSSSGYGYRSAPSGTGSTYFGGSKPSSSVRSSGGSIFGGFGRSGVSFGS